MNKKIDILLLEDVKNLGPTGTITSVSEGYARNMLFPQGKAALADAKAKQDAKQKQKQQQADQRATDQAAQATAEQLEGTELTIQAKVKDGDDIFGSITTTQVAKELSTQANIQLKAKDISMAEALTKLGQHDATVKLAGGIEANLKVTVVSEEE